MKTEKIYAQHEENKAWVNSLLFYKDDIKILTRRLEEVAAKNTSQAVLVMVEHCQNQLSIQKEQIDILNHEINLQNDVINSEIRKNDVAIDHRSIADHSVLREKMSAFEMIIRSVRTELMDFLSKWM